MSSTVSKFFNSWCFPFNHVLQLQRLVFVWYSISNLYTEVPSLEGTRHSDDPMAVLADDVPMRSDRDWASLCKNELLSMSEVLEREICAVHVYQLHLLVGIPPPHEHGSTR